MDAFGNFAKLWALADNPFKYLLDLKDEKGTPLYEPYPPTLRYPLISVFRRGWRFRTSQNYSIFQFRPLNWPTDSRNVNLQDLGNTLLTHRPMGWDYRWQIDHYAMRPDTQAVFVEALMRTMWLTGGTPQVWVPVHYPVWGWHRVRMFIDGDIENSTLEEPEDGKHVEFRTTFTLVMEGYSVDQDVRIVPALWNLIIRQGPAPPGQLAEAFNLQETTEDLRLHPENAVMAARGNLPPDISPQLRMAQIGTYAPLQIAFDGSSQPQAFLDFGFQSTNANNPYFMGGIPANTGFGSPIVEVLI